MNNDPEKAVTQGDSAAPADQPVINNVEETTIEQSGAQETNDSSIPSNQGNDEVLGDRPAINHDMEWKRKYNDLVDNLPKLIEENMKKVTQNNQPQKPEYTIEELEHLAIKNPELRPQVEAEKEKIRERRILDQIAQRDQKLEEQRRADVIRLQVENEVANDPLLKDCFTVDSFGRKQWNMAHPLTVQLSDIMRTPELAARPDGLKIAAEVAYGRYMREVASKNQSKVRAAQAAVKKEQRKTMIEGGVPSGSSSGGDTLTKLKSELAKTGSRETARLAVAEIMARSGFGR